MLAYLIAFWAQLESASTAGLCVAIVAQSSPGMALSKAAYRVLGTVLGGIVAVAVVGVFGQDRTLMLVAFTLWLGECTFVAALLRDFRSYGAVLCGYTVGIIAIASIDAPQAALITTLDRVAAILLGVACVAGVKHRAGAQCRLRNPGLRDGRGDDRNGGAKCAGRWPGSRRPAPWPARPAPPPCSR